jgi:hypothetical protein
MPSPIFKPGDRVALNVGSVARPRWMLGRVLLAMVPGCIDIKFDRCSRPSTHGKCWARKTAAQEIIDAFPDLQARRARF